MPLGHARNDKPVVVITGSTGLIGSTLTRRLADEYTLYGLDLTLLEEPIPTIRHLRCDLTDDQSVADALATLRAEVGDRIASVVHLAAYYDFAGEPSPLYDELTVKGTARLLRGLSEFQTDQFLFSSSMLVMKPVEEGDGPIDESSPTLAKWDYPKSKLAAEQVIREERGATSSVVLRIAGVYDEDCRSIPIGNQIKRIYERDFESHFYPGDQSHGQPFIHLEDLASAVEAAIEKRAELPEELTLLLAEDQLLSYGELQDRIGQELCGEEEWTTVWIPEIVAKGGAWAKNLLGLGDGFIKPWMIALADDHYPIDSGLAKQRLGWKAKHSLGDTLPEILRRLKADPDRWYQLNAMGEPPEDGSACVEREAAHAGGTDR